MAHQNGTIRFGHDPATSALDANCRAHEVDNLYVVDGSFFPSSGAVNPALTIMANALRVGDRSWSGSARARSAAASGADGGGRRMSLGVGACRDWLARAPPSLGADSRSRRSRASPGPAAARCPGSRPPERAAAPPGGQAVAMVGLTVSDMDRSVDFYTSVLGFEKVSDDEVAGRRYEQLQGVFGARMRVVRLRLGDEIPRAHRVPGAARPSRAGRLAEQRSLVPARRHHRERHGQRVRPAPADKVQHASTGPQLLPKTIPNAAGIRAFYFRDPDGHPLEMLQFPPDKGEPKWHAPSDRLFLGIDHTAIVVSDTEASLAFYRDVLGFRVAGESMNFGTEQEHLNNVPGARLRITGLRAAAGPGIEFLEYLSPRDGRPYPGGRARQRPGPLADHGAGPRCRRGRGRWSGAAGSVSSRPRRWSCPTPRSASAAAFWSATPTVTPSNS